VALAPFKGFDAQALQRGDLAKAIDFSQLVPSLVARPLAGGNGETFANFSGRMSPFDFGIVSNMNHGGINLNAQPFRAQVATLGLAPYRASMITGPDKGVMFNQYLAGALFRPSKESSLAWPLLNGDLVKNTPVVNVLAENFGSRIVIDSNKYKFDWKDGPKTASMSGGQVSFWDAKLQTHAPDGQSAFLTGVGKDRGSLFGQSFVAYDKGRADSFLRFGSDGSPTASAYSQTNTNNGIGLQANKDFEKTFPTAYNMAVKSGLILDNKEADKRALATLNKNRAAENLPPVTQQQVDDVKSGKIQATH
jgi:hypothetical protein